MALTLEEIRSRREEILAIAARHGAYNVRVFGSTVRGTASDESDVDFLVSLQPDRSLLDLIGLKLDLEEELGCSVDVLTDRGVHHYLRDEIVSSAVAV